MTEVASAAAAMPQNTPRQPSKGIAASSGALAVSAPIAPQAMTKPVIELCRSGGYHSANPFSAPIRQADTPRPIRARATPSPPMESPSANSTAPTPASSSKALSTRRGP